MTSIPKSVYDESEQALEDAVIKPLSDRLTETLDAYRQTAQQAVQAFHLPHPSEIFGGTPAPSAVPPNAQPSQPQPLTLPHPSDIFGGQPPDAGQTPSSAGAGASRPTGAQGMPASMPSGGASVGDGSPPGPISGDDRPQRISSARPYAQQAEQRTGVPADVNLAFAVHESGLEDRYGPGMSYHGRHATGDEPGTPINDWGYDAQGNRVDYPTKLKSYTDPSGSFNDFADLISGSPRYQPALQRYQQTGAVAQLIRDIWGAGYGESKTGPDETVNILQQQTSGPASPQQGASPSRPQAQSGQPQPMPSGGSSYTQQGLADAGDPDAWAKCGPVAAFQFAQKMGRNPTPAETEELARQVGWTGQKGMAGFQSEAALLSKMNIAARAESGVDWNKVITDVSRGNPVLLELPGHEGHYIAAQGYDSQTGKIDFGSTVGDLAAAGHKTQFTPSELEGLGWGTPTHSFYIDNPSTPAPSVVAGQSAPTAGPQPADSPPPPGGDGLPATAVGGSNYKLGADEPPEDGPSAGDQKRAKLAAAQGGTMLRQPLAPTDPDASMGQPYDPRAADDGPHEGAQPDLSQPQPQLVQDSGANDYPSDQYTEMPIAARTTAQQSSPVAAQSASPFLPLHDKNTGEVVGYVQGDDAPPSDPTITDPNYTGTPAGRQYDPNDPSTGVNPNAPGALRPTDLPPESQGARPWLPATTPAGGIQAPPGLVDTLVPRGAQTGPQFEGPAVPQRWSPAFQAQYGQGGEAAPFQDDQREPGYRPTPAPRTLSPYQPGSGNALAGVETPPSDQQILQTQGPIARGLNDALQRQGIEDQHPESLVNLENQQAFMNPRRASTPAGLMSWRDRVTVGEADALARGLGQEPENVLATVTIDGQPHRMTVSDLLQNVTDPLFMGGAGVGQVVLDGVGETALRLAAPYLKGAARAVVNRLLAEAGTLGAVARGAGSRVRGALADNAERVAAADARATEKGSTQLPGTLGAITGNPHDANAATRAHVVPPHVSDTLDFPVRVPTDPGVVRAIEAAGGSVDPERGVNLNAIRYEDPEAHGRPATRSQVFYTTGKPGEASPYAGANTGGKGVGGSERIEGPTTYRSPLVLTDAPGESSGFNEGMRQLGVTGGGQYAIWSPDGGWFSHGPLSGTFDTEAAAQQVMQSVSLRPGSAPLQIRELGAGKPLTADIIDRGITAARRAGPPGSPERAQALTDLVTRYGGDPAAIPELLAVRGADDSESAWAIKENILAHNARAKGYDGVLTVQHDHQGALDLLEQQIKEHPDYQTQQSIADPINQQYDRMLSEYSAVLSKNGMRATPESDAIFGRLTDLGEQARTENRKLQNIHDRLLDELPTPQAGKITELADFRESHNPTPAAPVMDAETRAAHEAYKNAVARDIENMRAYRSAAAQYGPDSPQALAAGSVAKASGDEADRLHDALTALQERLQRQGEPGYTLRSDLPKRPTGEPETASATAGTLPASVTAPTDRLGTVNRVLSQGVASAVSGGVGAQVNQQANPDDPYAGAKGFAAGALLPLAATKGASRLARALGRDGEAAGGALATFGASPNYRPPTPAALKAAEVQGARRGEMLNRPVTAPGSSVPLAVRAVTAATDDRAGMRWAEDILSDAAGKPRMRENDPLRPSTQSRVNAGSIANERIATDLEPAIQSAGAAGLQHELPQFLEDTHQKDILDAFYTRGKQAVLDDRAQKIAAAQANGASPAVIARMQAKAATDAERAGTAAMRTRQGGSTDMTYEQIEARLQAQEQRLTADGRWQQLQDSAQAVWDHNAETRQRLVDSGEMDPTVAADLATTYPHYVPTVPISHLTEGGGGVASSTTTVSRGTTPVVRALDDVGTSGERLNPIVATRNATVRAERAIQKNNVARAFAQMMDDAIAVTPAATATNPATHRTFLGGGVDVSYFENGKPVTMSVPRPVADGIEAASNMGVDANGVTSVLKRITRAVTSTLTAARASFVPVNVMRDMSDYATRTMAREGSNPARLPAILGTWADEAGKAALDIMASNANGRSAVGAAAGFAAGALPGDDNTPLSTRLTHGAEGAAAGVSLGGANRVRTTGKAAEFLARGGGEGAAQGSLKAGQRWYRDVMREGGAPLTSPAGALRSLGDWAHDVMSLQGIKAVSERTETISRTAAMRRAESSGAGAIEAMIAGRDASVDFDRAGTVTRAWNGYIPFLNATVQGGAQFVRMMKQNPVGTTAAITATLGPVMLATEYYNRSDPARAQAYDDVPQYIKDAGIVLMMPGAGGSDTRGSKPNYLWLPTEVLTPFVVGMRAAMQHADAVVPGMEPSAGRSDTNQNSAAPQTLGALNEALSVFYPVRGDSAASIGSTFVPPIAKQAIELSQNKDMFRGGTIQSASQDERASGFGHAVANAANATGRALGSTFLQDVHPSQVDYLARQLPAYGDLVTGASDMVRPSPYKQAEQGRIANEPFVGGPASRFVRDAGGANLERAQGQMMTPGIQEVLQDANMHPGDAKLDVPSSYKSASLTRDEQLRWQEAANAEMARALPQARRDEKWRNPATRASAVTAAISAAQQAAAERVLRNLTPAVIEQRQRAEQARQREVAGVR